MKNKLNITISGPTGAGKTILAERISKFLAMIGYTITYSIPESKFSTLSPQLINKYILDTSVEITEKNIKKQKVVNFADMETVEERIFRLNVLTLPHKYILYYRKSEKIGPDKSIFQANLVVQETNIENYYFIHKNRYSGEKILTREELFDLLGKHYES